ncbi:PTS system mannose/fructose/sorbose family transporter subunit IID [Clostridium neuense]|uniref:PTS system mannose/fructose/sorbose family transporter subunit IID n=1 Tax=Clostridium neuense TaxID=1728934 RepID=A0ABW8TKM7_9CLOT
MTTNSNTDSKKITKKDLKKVFWRSFTLEGSWNYERMSHMGYAYAMVPILKKLYTKKEDLSKALKRHLEFMNITPHVATLLLGISTAMEEQNANDENFDESSISSVKTGLMGPIAGIGDSFVWGTLKIIAAGVGISLASQGNILGPILFLLIFNVPLYILRYICMFSGYKLGTGLLSKVEESGVMGKVTYGAAILGVMVIGGMTATMVNFTLPFMIGTGKTAVKLQSILDGIMPALLPLGLTGIIYYLLGKGAKSNYIILALVAMGIGIAALS